MSSVQLGAPDIAQNQAAAVTANEAVAYLDAHVHLSVKDRDLTAPPGSPATGDRYLIATSPTGAWSGQAGKVAFYLNGAWKFTTPKEGWTLWVDDEDKRFRYDGSAWREVALQRVLSKTITIANPTTSEFIYLGQLDHAITIRRIVATVAGTTPSRTITLRKGTDLSASGTEVVTGGSVVTNTTTGLIVTSFNSPGVAANNHLWMRTTAGSGTVTLLAVHIEYTED